VQDLSLVPLFLYSKSSLLNHLPEAIPEPKELKNDHRLHRQLPANQLYFTGTQNRPYLFCNKVHLHSPYLHKPPVSIAIKKGHPCPDAPFCEKQDSYFSKYAVGLIAATGD
jgi:hypothetical protein